jgi:hypothetical protein
MPGGCLPPGSSRGTKRHGPKKWVGVRPEHKREGGRDSDPGVWVSGLDPCVFSGRTRERQAAARRRSRLGAWAGAQRGSGVHGWVVLGRAPMGEGGRLADRGPRAAAGGCHKKECPAICSGPAAPTPHPWICSWVWLAGPWVRGRRFPMSGRRTAVVPGRGRWQGTKGRLSREDQEKVEVHLRLVPGRIKGPGQPPHNDQHLPHDGQPIGRPICTFPRSQASFHEPLGLPPPSGPA